STTTAKGTSSTTAAVSKPATPTAKGSGAAPLYRTPSTSLIAVRHPAATATTTKPAATPTTKGGTPATTKAGATAPAPTTTTEPAGTPCRDHITKPEQDIDSQTVFLPDRDPKQGCYELAPAVLTGKSVSTARASYQNDGWGVDVTFKGNDFVQKI